jgi:DNA recombination protein RmuC
LAEKSNTADKLGQELQTERSLHEATRKEADDLRRKLAALNERLEQETAKSAEKLALLTDAREIMANEFKVLAETVMTRHGEAFTKQNKEQVEGILNPLREKLVEFQQGLQTAHVETAKDRASLEQQIRNLSEASASMRSETHNLTQALKGKAQTQGAWGEMILTTILERSGLREGDEYVKQQSHTGEDGSRLRPDVIVNLPGGQRVVIDAKVSLTAFEEHVNATDETVAAAALTRHVGSMRTHVRTLASKDYQSVVGSGLDYVIMFVPIEGALAIALQEQPDLTNEAAGTNVAIATPTTLMMALRTIANVWGVERRNRNAEEIAERAGKLYDKFHGFVGDMQLLGILIQIATVWREAVR